MSGLGIAIYKELYRRMPMKTYYSKLKENAITAIGVVLFFVLVFANEILFKLEYFFKRTKKPGNNFSNKLVVISKTTHSRLPTPISTQQDQLQWLKKNKRSF